MTTKKESFGDRGKWTSHVRKWEINKEVKMQPVVIDFEKKILSYNGSKFWIRFETQSKLYVYAIPEDKTEHLKSGSSAALLTNVQKVKG